MERHYTLSETAKMLGVTTQTLRSWDKTGKINAIRTPGNQRRIPESEIWRLSAIVGMRVSTQEPKYTDPILLMCKDVEVYDVSHVEIIDKALLPGCILHGTMSYDEWMKTRYSAGTNVSARRLMLAAFGSDNHKHALLATRTLSLSDCYWLKRKSEDISFVDITPYLHREWDGTGTFRGGSISTLFVNGASDKRWLDSNTLLKVKSFKEYEPYELCAALDLTNVAETVLSDEGILLANFTSTECFLESMEQSGYSCGEDNPREKAVEFFKEQAVALFVVDYLVEHDDRHWGNYGFLRDCNTGEYLSMAPYYDFDWAWSGDVVSLPDNAYQTYKETIWDLCERAITVADKFEHREIIKRRASELLVTGLYNMNY